MSLQDEETKTIPQLLQELKRWKHDVRDHAEAARHTQATGSDANEMWREVAEYGLIIGQLQRVIAERYAQAFRDSAAIILDAERLTPEQLESQFEEGIKHMEARDYHLAIPIFHILLLHDPTSWLAYYYLGLIWLELNKYTPAVDDFSEALRLKPDFAEAYIRRAEAYSRLRQYQEEINDLTEFIRLSPPDIDGYRARGLALFSNKQYQEAIVDLTQAILLDSTDSDAYYFRAGVFIELGKYEQALADCHESLRHDSESLRHHPKFWLLQSRMKEIHAKMASEA